MDTGGRLIRAALAISALGIAADVVIATHLGSSGTASLAASIVLGAPLILAAGWQIFAADRIRPSPAPFWMLAGFVGWSALTFFATGSCKSTSLTTKSGSRNAWN